jgi:hypothetical protein
MDALAVNGVSSEFVRVQAKNQEHFMVNHWWINSGPSYQGDPDGYTYWLRLVPETGSHGMAPAPNPPVYGDFLKLPTLKGQNTAPPAEAWFVNHYIVKFAGGGAEPYYDPSYGTRYSGEDDFEDDAVAGYTRPYSGLDHKVRSSDGMHNIEFDK